MVLGLLSLFIWPLPFGGLAISIVGLALGIIVSRRGKAGMAVAGIVLASIGLLLALAELKFGVLDIILRAYFAT